MPVSSGKWHHLLLARWMSESGISALEEIIQPTFIIVRQGLEELDEWRKANSTNKAAVGVGARRFPLWHPPPKGYVKCNTDATIFERHNFYRIEAV
ncbi:hypothetical protein LINPERPRIM_LOCUS5014, partial [Linum perenne]